LVDETTTVMPLLIRRLLAAALLGLIALAFGAVATHRIGYVTTNGVSMQPTYHAGDLVVVARAGTYRIGDIAAYNGGAEGRLTVLHRIIGGDASGFVLQGDNNESVDPIQPTADQLIGRAVVHIPRVGAAVGSPITRGLLILVAVAVIAALVISPRKRPARVKPSPPARSRHRRGIKALVALDVVLVVALAALLVVGAPAAAPLPAAITQTGTFTYRAAVPVSEIYPSGRLVTGDPVFTKLVDTVEVSFVYTTNAAPASVTGTVGLDAELSGDSGWHTTLSMVPPTAVVAGTVELVGTLQLSELQALATRVTEATEVGSPMLAVAVTATTVISLDGAAPVTATTKLPFRLTPLLMSLADVKPTASNGKPTVAITSALGTPSTPPRSSDVRRKMKFGLIGAILLAVGATIVLWPKAADEDDDDGDDDDDATAPSEAARPLASVARHQTTAMLRKARPSPPRTLAPPGPDELSTAMKRDRAAVTQAK
jgi:signal peptidase I